jgi:hypothetical protein
MTLWQALDVEQRVAQLAAINLRIVAPPSGPDCVICLRCWIALSIQSNGVSQHLCQVHNTPSAARRNINSYLCSLGLANPKDLPNLPDYSPLQSDLRQYPDGGACRHCNFRSVHHNTLLRHLQQYHPSTQIHAGWAQKHLHYPLLLQSWVQNPPKGYWIARPGSPQAAASSPPSSALQVTPRRQAHISALNQEEEESRPFTQASPVQTTRAELTDENILSNWMKRTQWDKTYRSAPRGLLQSLYQSPRWSVPARPLLLGQWPYSLFSTDLRRTSFPVHQ